jgi:hypothetical protein
MTPEERFQKIENALAHASELQAQHAELHRQHAAEILALAEVQKQLGLAVLATNKTVALLATKVDVLADSIAKFLKGNRPNGH